MSIGALGEVSNPEATLIMEMRGEMLRSKYFWIAMVILVPFIVVWVMYGLAWALGMLGIIGVLILFVLGGTRRRRTRIYRVYEDEDEEDVIIMERQPQRRSDYSERVRDLYFPKGLRNIHQDGLNELGKRQRADLNETLRRLRRLR
jgi:fatty acid desaturase